MLNTVLTVRAHQANSHRGIGWEEFTDAAIMALNGQDRPIVFILWGAPAQRKKAMLNNPKHLILTAPHPSPLSAYRIEKKAERLQMFCGLFCYRGKTEVLRR